jgi:hypothetical protein
MNIIETNINDIPNDLNQVKLDLANSVIQQIQPLFDKEYINKIKEVKRLKNNIDLKKEQVNNEKVELEKLIQTLDKKKKEQLLLERVGKLVGSGLIQESMKKELVILLKSFDGMDSERINSYLNESMTIISKKFAKT